MIKKILVLCGLVVIGGLVYFFFFYSQRKDMQENVAETPDISHISEQVHQFHNQLVVADLHADNLLWDRDPLKRLDYGHVDIPRLIEGNFGIEVFDAVIKVPFGHNYFETRESSWDQITFLAMANRWPARTWFGLAERAVYQSEVLHEAARNSGGKLEIIRTSGQLNSFLAERSRDPNRVAGILSIEGLHALEGEVANLQRFYQAGYRIMGPVHFFDNQLGGSSGGMNKGGINEFGKLVIKEMDNMELIIDLAHASSRLIMDVLELTHRPVVVSHTGVQGIVNIPRNLSDTEIKAIANRGGLIGIGFWNDVVGDLKVASIVKSIRYTVEIAGVDHVGLGSDFDGLTHVPFDASEIVVLTDALLDAGFSEEEVTKIMGGNLVRFLQQNLPDN